MRCNINGRDFDPSPGGTLAAAAMAAGLATRTSVSGEPRGPLCGMGICFECRASVDGIPHQRTCQIPVAAATSNPPFDPRPASLLVVGGGPAGLAAAARAAEAGLQVTLLDDNPELGGQIWRGRVSELGSEAASWAARVRAAGVRLRLRTRVVDAPAPGVVRAESPHGLQDFHCERLLLSTGARERFLPFPGWTRPSVLGAGGLQAMVKSGLPIAGKRVVVAGTGPLLVAVAAYLRQHGATIVALCDQASWLASGRFFAALPIAKLRQGLELARALRGVPLWMNAWPIAARQGGVVMHHDGARRDLECDYLACGFHLVPNTELATLLGCDTQHGAVLVDPSQETTVPGVYCAGEPTGVGGVELALVEGEIAGLAAAGGSPSSALLHRREKLHRFARRLHQLCALRPELRALPEPQTLVCRCEDVSFARLSLQSDWRAAKLHTRCGMGACQGRVCGPACEFIFGWHAESIRPPIFPAPLAALGNECGESAF